jgi:hypothetical protein
LSKVRRQKDDLAFCSRTAGSDFCLLTSAEGKKYGLRLMPELYECYNPMPYEAALDMEIELGIHLRAKG